MEMSTLKWEPAALNFSVALNKASMQQQLRTRNTSSSNVAYTFRVQTTNPKRYSVRPNVGVVWPSKDVTVTVQLPAMKESPSDMNKCKDKFQVLTLPLKSEMAEKLKSMSADQQLKELTDLWASSDAKNAVVDKIHCSMTFDSSFRMSLLEPGTYKRPDAEVLPLITHATARATNVVRRISHQRCCARHAGHRPLSRAAILGTTPVCRPAGRLHAQRDRQGSGRRVDPPLCGGRPPTFR